MAKSLRLKRHETFSIREGWLEKGLNIIPMEPKCLSKDNGPSTFGLGSNMCKSLRYWLEACGIATFNLQGGELTEFGNILKETDPYLEREISWWFIHCYLAMNIDDAPVINEFFNMQINKMDKDYIFRNIKDAFERKYGDVSADSSLDSDITVLLKSYCIDDFSNPENNLNCPFARLGLVRLSDRKFYSKQAPSYSSLSYKAIYWCILKCLNINEQESFNIEDLLLRENNPTKIFNISKSTLYLYLEEMKRNNMLNFVKTAGLNIVTMNKIFSLSDLLKK